MGKSCLGCLVAALLLVIPNLAAAGVPEVKIGADFQGVGYTVTSTGKIVVLAGMRNIDGKLAVCGVVVIEKASATTEHIEPKFTDQIKFSVAGKYLRVNSRAFPRYKSEADAKAGNAGCAVTNTAWQAAYAKTALSMTLGNVTVRD